MGNHREFLAFLLAFSAHCLFLAIISILVLCGYFPLLSSPEALAIWEQYEPAFISSFRATYNGYTLKLIQAYIAVLAISFGGPTFILLCLQLRNVATNLTTNEVFNKDKYPYLKNNMDEFYNPFDQGIIHNYGEICCNVSAATNGERESYSKLL